MYETIHISAYDTPNFTGETVPAGTSSKLVSPSWAKEKLEQWGEDSPMYHVRVLGNFPTESDDQVVSLRGVEEAQKRDIELGDNIVIACDVARFGTDETVIAVRRGNNVRIHKTYTKKSLMETAGYIIDTVRSVSDYGVARIVIDDAGLGGGVTDRLRELGVSVEAFNGGSAPNEPDLYPNRRSEAWFAFAEQLSSIDLDPDDQLAADLVAPKYALDSRGRRVVEPKDKTKQRLGRSPDRADAVLMAFAPAMPMGISYGPDIWSN